MPSNAFQIKNVPPDTRQAFAKAAVKAGVTQATLLAYLVKQHNKEAQ